MINMHNTPPWVDSVRMNFDYIENHLLPPVSEDDDGKIMTVVNGEWSAVTVDEWTGGDY